MFHPSILRQYDIRGVYQKTLFEEDAYQIGLRFGFQMKGLGAQTICVAYDGRVSSPALEKALIRGLIETGLQVKRLGVGPTPYLYYSVYEGFADCGIMVTGSHNPPQDNGFKFVGLKAKPFYGDDIQTLNNCQPVPGVRGMVADCFDIKSYYIARLLKDFVCDQNLKIAWDPGHGAVAALLEDVVKQIPATHVVINNTVDGTFPAHPADPTVAENLVQLQECVLNNKCDIGFAFDGDGDRIGVVDREGHILWGDQILTFLASSILKQEPGAAIIADVKASKIFFDQVKALGGIPIMWQTGHSLIKAKMLEIGAPLAGEMSGHIFIKHEYYGFDDALYVALRMLKECHQHQTNITSFYHSLPKSFTSPEIRLDCADEEKFEKINRLKAYAYDNHISFCDIDGLRKESDQGWWLLRASNTQPALIVRWEGVNEAAFQDIKAEVAQFLRLIDIDL